MPRRCPLVERTTKFADREWRFRAVENQDLLLDSVVTEADLEAFPYGMLVWASSIGLCEWLVENQERIKGASVLELGSGAGLPGIVAQWLGAEVVQTDYQPETLALAESNAALNGVCGIRNLLLDWRNPTGLYGFDLVIAADVLYERPLHSSLKEVLERTVRGRGIIADPVRPQGIEFIDRLEKNGWLVEMGSRMVHWEEQRKEVAVYEITKQNGPR